MDIIATSMIVGYLAAVTLLGIVLALRSKTSSQWAVAGGSMGTVMVAMGVAGTRIGGAGTYGVAGDVITEGVWNLWYGVSTFLALALVGIFFARAYRRLGLQTVGEIFWIRFQSRRCQRLTSLCVQTEYLIINIIEPYVIAKILQGATGMDFSIAIFIGAGVIIVYTALGGLWGAAVTNVVHCTVVLIGLCAVCIAGMSHLGGWSGITEGVSNALAASGKDSDKWWSLTGAGWGAIIAMILSAVVHTPAASVYVNFASAAKSERVLVRAFLVGGFVGALMPLLAGFIGMQTLATYGAEAQLSSYASITRLATDVNPWIGGIALAAILAAVISSGGPILLSSATMFVNDWLPFAGKMSEKNRLLAFRLTTVVYGLVAATIAWLGNIGSILDLVLLAFSAVVPPAIAVSYLLYWKRTTETGAFWGTAVGYAGGLLWYGAIRWTTSVGFSVTDDSGFWHAAIHYCFVNEGKGVDPSYVTTFVPLLLIPAISLLTRENLEGKDKFYAKLRPVVEK